MRVSVYVSVFLIFGLGFSLISCVQNDRVELLPDKYYSGQQITDILEGKSKYESSRLNYGNDTVSIQFYPCDNQLRGLMVANSNLRTPRDSIFLNIYHRLVSSAGKNVRVKIIDSYPRQILDPDRLIYVYDTRYLDIGDRNVLVCK